MKKGGTTLFELALEHIGRPEVVATLQVLLRSEDFEKRGVAIGEIGTGKSTAMRNAIMDLEEPKGMAYFSCPNMLKHFGKDMAAAVRYKFVVWDVVGRWCRGLSGDRRYSQPLASYAICLASSGEDR